MSKTFSGKKIIKILCRNFGFYFVSQNGSHTKLRKSTSHGIVTTIVPVHKELSIGIFHDILEQAEVDVHDFFDKI